MLTIAQLEARNVKQLQCIARAWNGTDHPKREEMLVVVEDLLIRKGGKMPKFKVKGEVTPASPKKIAKTDAASRATFDLIMADEDMDPIVRRELLTATKHAQLYVSAKSRKMDFNLTLPDTRKLVTTKHCAYTGAVLDETGSMNTRTVDRIDANEGYVKGNVLPVSKKANEVKNMLLENDHDRFKMTKDEFTMFATTMLTQLHPTK